mgnify:CR=1 FL=1
MLRRWDVLVDALPLESQGSSERGLDSATAARRQVGADAKEPGTDPFGRAAGAQFLDQPQERLLDEILRVGSTEPITVDVRNQTFGEALQSITNSTRTFFRVTAPRTITIIPDTPAKRIYLAVQLMYTSREAQRHHELYFSLIRDIVQAAPSTWALVEAINNHILTGEMYKALKDTKKLIAYEEELLSAARGPSLWKSGKTNLQPT